MRLFFILINTKCRSIYPSVSYHLPKKVTKLISNSRVVITPMIYQFSMSKSSSSKLKNKSTIILQCRNYWHMMLKRNWPSFVRNWLKSSSISWVKTISDRYWASIRSNKAILPKKSWMKLKITAWGCLQECKKKEGS